MRDGDFHVRSKEISRIEGLSDAVFGFAITLLVVSLEVPKTSAEVLHAMRGFVPFALTFTILVLIWRTQFRFFRRYGLEDNTTLALNAVLLFTVLFFVYPMKFIFGEMSERLLTHLGYGDPSAPNLFTDHNTRFLMIAYGLGWATVNGVFMLLYRHADAQRERLRLSDLEVFDTEQSIQVSRIAALFGLIIAATNFVGHVTEQRSQGLTAWVDLIGNVIAMGMMVRLFAWRRRRRKRRAAFLASGNHPEAPASHTAVAEA